MVMDSSRSLIWPISMLLWVCIIFVIFAFYVDEDVAKITSITFVSIVCASYYYLTFVYIYRHYFSVNMTIDEFYKHIDKIFKSSPLVTMSIICYRLVRSPATRFSNGYRYRKITHEQTEEFRYRSWKDITGELRLETSAKPYLLLDLDLLVSLVKDGTQEDYKRTGADFIARNTFDTHQIYNKLDSLPGFREYILIHIVDEIPSLFGPGFFTFFGLITLSAVYLSYLDSCCHMQSFTIKKTISTRQDLDTLDIKRSNTNLDPVIITANQVVVFDPLQPPQIIELNQLGAPQYPIMQIKQQKSAFQGDVGMDAPESEFYPAPGCQLEFVMAKKSIYREPATEEQHEMKRLSQYRSLNPQEEALLNST